MPVSCHHLALAVFGLLPERLRRRVLRLVSPTFTVGALCLVENRHASFLLVRHSYRSGWGLPGGIVKRHEDVEAAAHREVREEVCLEIDVIGPPSVVVDPVQRRVDVIFAARAATCDGSIDPSPCSAEIAEVRWMTRDEITTLQLREELQTETAGALRARGLLDLQAANRSIPRRSAPEGREPDGRST